MRIVAGEWRGRTLRSPSWDGLRPTSDRLRETLFNILGPSIGGARVLVAFAGTGAIGIEALSRGAAWVCFVDSDPRAVKLVDANLASLAADRRYAIIRADVTDAAARCGGAFDLAVFDPPYAADAAERALDAASHLPANGRLRVVVEHAKRHAPPSSHAGFALVRTVTAGDSALSFYERG
jgi:16S rRNA (guanine(966)-N(2))-methyltransferase RsmD